MSRKIQGKNIRKGERIIVVDGRNVIVKRRVNPKRTGAVFLLFLLLCLFMVTIVKYVGKSSSNIFGNFSSVDEESNDEVLALSSNISKVYLALGGTKELNIDFDVNGEPDKTLEWSTSDESVVTVENGVITGVGVGETKVTAKSINGKEISFDVLITDLITVPTLNNDKPYLPCDRYTKEEADLLDEILEARVNEAGYGTRGGVVAAIRFLLLEFPYSIRYFNENGRLSPGYPQIDAEGRYYHVGLYLHSSKFEYLKPNSSTSSGPAIWGCKLYDSFISSYNSNGLTCSGFVTWAMLNGGLETGDVGAGDYPNVPNEISDLGENQPITTEFMANGQYKPGDVVGRDGHVGIIMGISEDTIYTAESLPPKLEVYIYERYSGIVKDDNLDYIINMDNIYPNGEGIYTDMW